MVNKRSINIKKYTLYRFNVNLLFSKSENKQNIYATPALGPNLFCFSVSNQNHYDLDKFVISMQDIIIKNMFALLMLFTYI